MAVINVSQVYATHANGTAERGDGASAEAAEGAAAAPSKCQGINDFAELGVAWCQRRGYHFRRLGAQASLLGSDCGLTGCAAKS